MLIDWFTVGAQVLNFLILVWLMKRFLYKPILKAIDAREERIASQIADAESTKSEAQKQRDAFQNKNEAFDQERDALLTKATDAAATERQRLFDEARQAADALSAEQQDALRNDALHLNQAIARRTQEEVFAITRKTLASLANTSLEAQMSDVFTNRIRTLDDEAKASLSAALTSGSEPALVRSAFDLPESQRSHIQTALNESFSANIPLRFEIAPEQMSGIELTANGNKVAWSIADFLKSLETGIDELLQKKAKPTAKAEATGEANGGAEKDDSH